MSQRQAIQKVFQGGGDEAPASVLPVFQTRCRGSCDYIQKPGRMSLVGEQVGVRVLKDRCPQCDGRMMELYLRYAGRRQ